MDVASLPFNRSIGITTEGNATVLSPRKEHLNHVGTVHATVVYGIAEAASGQCLLNRFPDFSESFVAVLRSSKTKYRRPALEEAEIRGVGELSATDAATFLDTLQSKGRATIGVAVSVSQNGTELFSGTFTWFAGQK